MTLKSGLSAPEIAGFSVLSGTLGAILAGASLHGLTFTTLIAAAGGTLLFPALVKLFRLTAVRRFWVHPSETVSG